MSKVFGGMAASLDGFIATKDGDVSWLNNAMAPDEDYGFSDTVERAGAYIIGANTYREMVNAEMGGGGGTTPTYVVTHRTDIEESARTHRYSGDLRALVDRIKSETDKDICLYGGADLVTQFINLGLLDELGISIIPVLLGDGVPFFGRIHERKTLELFEHKRFRSGIVLLNYRLKGNASTVS